MGQNTSSPYKASVGWLLPQAYGVNLQYLNDLCVLIDRVTDVNWDIFLLGDMNIDWLANQCPIKQKMVSLTNACKPSQVVFATNQNLC